uniref:Uncharacterized protein n=1 Tax=Denticeps clupeoides TaxID=299321 RepID=A0AAY4E106_9TELE
MWNIHSAAVFCSTDMTSLLEEGLIKTTSIDQVVAPITTRLCHLILLCESRDGPPEQFAHLETGGLSEEEGVSFVFRIMVDSEDDVLRMEMSPLVESMTVAGQHVLLASQKLSIQPNLVEHREELILATQNVLLGVILCQILLAEDDATVRKIVSAAHWVKDCVSKIGASENIPDLLKAFQVFSRAMLLLNRLVEEQVGDLRDPIQRESVKTSLDTLKKCISMLHTAAYTTIKHPGSEQGQAAKTYILQQVESTVTNITSTLQSNCSWAASGPSGYYHGLDILLRDLVFHCMMVAKTSRNELQPQVTQHCIRALQHWSDISQELKVEDDRHLQLRPHLHDLCAALMQQVHELDSAVVTAALCQ